MAETTALRAWDDSTRAWAEAAVGSKVVRCVPLVGGITSTMLGLRLRSGRRCVLRLMDVEPWRRHAVGLLERESQVQERLVGEPVPAPVSLATDLDATATSAPAHLMSWLPGACELRRRDGAVLDRLAAVLGQIHAVSPSLGARPRTFQSWAPPEKWVVPAWSQHPAAWQRAFELLAGPAPSYVGAFLHRDFHLGNILWIDGRVSGVVDWVETSWGPRGLDVAHCATYLAMLHGPEAATAFVERYATLAGGPAEDLYWHVMDVVGFLPDPLRVVRPWSQVGVDVAAATAQHRLEQRLLDVLGGGGGCA